MDLDRKHDADWYRKQQGQQPHHGLIAQCHHGREPLWFHGHTALHWPLGKLGDFQVLAADRGSAGAREGWWRQSSASQAPGGQLLRPRGSGQRRHWHWPGRGLPDLLTLGCTMQFTRSYRQTRDRASRRAADLRRPGARAPGACYAARAQKNYHHPFWERGEANTAVLAS